MSDLEQNDVLNKTTTFFSKLNRLWSISGLPNLWIDKENDKKISKYYHRIITLFLFVFIFMEIGAFFSQQHLTEKQKNDRLLFGFSHPILICYYLNLEYHKTKVKKLLIILCITLKKVYNDPDVEKRMIRKGSFYSTIFLLSVCGALVCYGFDGLLQVMHSGGSFTTVVTIWPDVEDNSLLAKVLRIIIYLAWWVFMTRVSAAIAFLIMITVLLSHQYKNLQSYFYSLNDLFQANADEVNHSENELKYVEALKIGIKLHFYTLWCTKQCQKICSLIYSGQIMINIYVLCVLMLQMVNSERTLVNVITIICTGVAVLGSSGFVMWNAGDITYEAALVPTAIYSSGWHHCRGKTSTTVRKLLMTAMIQGQKGVVLRSFGIINISYQSYLLIVKSSYSAFSLLY